jgi:hypothetical protein
MALVGKPDHDVVTVVFVLGPELTVPQLQSGCSALVFNFSLHAQEDEFENARAAHATNIQTRGKEDDSGLVNEKHLRIQIFMRRLCP